MYESFFGVRERPFDLSPNPRFLLLTPTHREALANLEYGLTGRKGLTLMLGEAGSGKTTVIRAAIARWQTTGHLVAHLNNPTLTRNEFIEFLTDSFALSAAAAASKTRFLSELTALATERHSRGLLTGLLIDEAQSLSAELLEEVRLLVNIETATDKLFQVILVGQPELATRLNDPGLRQIKQRVALRCSLATLSVSEVAAYIAGRIHVAGGVAAKVFTREAVRTIHSYSGGVPRVISVICDNAMLAGFAANRRPVTSETVEEVCRDFDLQSADGARSAGAAAAVVAAPDVAKQVSPTPVVTAPQKPSAAPTDDESEQEPAARVAGSRQLFEHYSARPARRSSFF
jgi:type II secretory pathway predicted ATPase ExeA